MTLAKRDLCGAWGELSIPEFACSTRAARVCDTDSVQNGIIHNGKLYLQDLDLPAERDSALGAWAEKIAPLVSDVPKIFGTRFAVVDDDTMAFLWETATQVDSRIRRDELTRTVADGALWREESLPPETLMIGVLEAGPSRKKGFEAMKEADVMDFALQSEAAAQFGGKATTGRGRCRIIPIAAQRTPQC